MSTWPKLDSAIKLHPLLFRMLVNLVESGEAFPGAIDNPERAREIAGRFGFSAGSPRGFAGYLSKMVYGPDVAKVIEILREEVDWTLERAVMSSAMSTEATPAQSEIAAALHEMRDGFREAGVLPNTNVDHASQPVPAPDDPEVGAIVSPENGSQG